MAACAVAGSVALLTAPTASAQTVSAPLTVTTIAGAAGQAGWADGNGTAARFLAPAGVVLDASGNLIIADTYNNVVRKLTPAGVVSTLAGSPVDVASNRPINIGAADGTGPSASFHLGEYAAGGTYNDPSVMTFGSFTLGADSAGNVYLADTLSHTIRKITSAGVVSTLAGSANNIGTADGTGGDARFLAPGGVGADAAGTVYVADSGNDTIRKITAQGVVTTFAGSPRAFGSTDGIGSAARFTNPSGVVVDKATGNIFVTDTGNHTIRKITSSGVVTTLAGSAGRSGSADGSGSAAQFNSPTAITIDANGNLYVADSGNSSIRKVSPSGTVTTVAGTAGTIGTADGTGTAALFNQPYGVAVDGSGTLYIADTGNQTIRRGLAATGSGSLQVTGIPPALIQTTTNSSVTLKIAASGNPSPTYQWLKNGTAISGATNATLQLNGVTSADAAKYSVIVTSGSVTYTSAPTTLQVFAAGTAVPTVTILTQPTDRSVAQGQSASFTVEASSAQALTYQWYKNGTAIAGATSTTYTISSAQASDVASYTVSVTDGTSTATTSAAALSITGASTGVGPVITTQPISQTIAAGATVSFSVVATGTPAPAFQWQKNGATLSNSANVSGATTATLTLANVSAADAATYTVVATNSAGSALSSGATLALSTTTPPTNAGHIANMSVLTGINAGESFTFGYYLGGSGTSGSKPILMRAMGPSLGALGVGGTLSDPYMEFYNSGSSTVVASNDNWNGDASIRAAVTAVSAFPFLSDTSKDAAIYAPNVSITTGHSIKVSGMNGSAGTVIAELYDVTSSDQFTATTPRLINVSLMKNVGTGTTLGFYITGSSPVKVLIRAVGPTLKTLFGVGDALSDPKMALYAQSNTATALATNDDWAGTDALKAAFTATSAFNLDATSKDAAMVQTLQPGGYSVQVSPATGATGTALIEIYEVPSP